MIAKDSTKILLLKFMLDRKEIAGKGHRIGNLPLGVFREVIKFVKY